MFFVNREALKMTKSPCKVGDTVYRIGNLCEQDCEFETEVCQQRTCRHFVQQIFQEKVAKVECKMNGFEEGIFIRTEDSERSCLLGEIIFVTKEEAMEYINQNWREPQII